MFPFAPKSTLNLLALRYLFHFRFFLLNFLFCFEFRLCTNQSTFLKHTTKSIWSSWQRISSSIPNKRTNRYSITGTNLDSHALPVCMCVWDWKRMYSNCLWWKPIEKFIKKVKVEKTRLHTDARGNKLKRRAVCIRTIYNVHPLQFC